MIFRAFYECDGVLIKAIIYGFTQKAAMRNAKKFAKHLGRRGVNVELTGGLMVGYKNAVKYGAIEKDSLEAFCKVEEKYINKQ